MVLLFILESLGSTELLFILVMALIFFGPRKLPQISRSLGKSLAEFRRASDDFKRTWEREVAMEANSIASLEPDQNEAIEPHIEPIPAENAIARDLQKLSEPHIEVPQNNRTDSNSENLPKRDWL